MNRALQSGDRGRRSGTPGEQSRCAFKLSGNSCTPLVRKATERRGGCDDFR
jgi:hypothetical protein